MSDPNTTPPDAQTVVRTITDCTRLIADSVSLLPVPEALAAFALTRGQIDAAEASLLSAQLAGGASDRSVESLLQRDGKTSKRKARAGAKRASAVNKNPDIASKLASGDLSPDQADVIAEAADKTGGAAANDTKLIEDISGTTPDQGRKIADEFVREHTARDTAQERHDKARRLRKVRRWETDQGTHVLALEGDRSSIDDIELSIRRRSDALYRADGGRDRSDSQHPRSRHQRNFDAAVQLLTGTSSDRGKGAADGHRTTVVVTMTTDQVTGADPSPVRQVGGGILAPTVLDRLMCNAGFVGQIYSQTGEVLWQGEKYRYFTDAQLLALIARDRGCVLCGTHYSFCEAHHLIPWNAWIKGPTDIDNGALVCSDCHHRIHDHDLILFRDETTGAWRTRPAEAAETVRRREPETSAGSRSSPRSRSGPTKPKLHERTRTDALF